jgi:hypothetical protein
MTNKRKTCDRYRRTNATWSVTDEIIFIDGLGDWTINPSGKSTAHLLQTYITTNTNNPQRFIPEALKYAQKRLAAVLKR